MCHSLSWFERNHSKQSKIFLSNYNNTLISQVTKSKIWKDVAGMLGIGASSSAAYTLRKHYTKNLLAFECHYDRGGIDPIPIIQQVEAGSKKKTPKPASAPSPGNLYTIFSSFSFLLIFPDIFRFRRKP